MTLGEPYAGKPPVRFDEGRRCETGTDNRGQFNPAVTPRLLYWQTRAGAALAATPLGFEGSARRRRRPGGHRRPVRPMVADGGP